MNGMTKKETYITTYKHTCFLPAASPCLASCSSCAWMARFSLTDASSAFCICAVAAVLACSAACSCSISCWMAASFR